MNNESLYALTTELQEIEDILLDSELTEDQQKDLSKKQDHLLILLQSKTDACVGYALSLDDYLSLVEKRISEMNFLKKQIEGKISRYENYTKICLDKLGVKEIKGQFCSIKIPKARQKVEILDESKIPVEFLKIVETTSIDVAGIGAMLKEGKEVSGATLIDGKVTPKFKTGK